jgi:peptidyl-prolyl cis-trans isomerase A (cyclophilin A)
MRRIVPVLLLTAACSTDPCGGPPPEPRYSADHVLLHPDSPELKEVPPDSFDVVFETSAGPVRVRMMREWAPLGVYRFYNLARHGFYDGSRFYRVLPGFVAQFGASGDPAVDQTWVDQELPDDPRRVPNSAGTLAFAARGPDTRTTQLFFTYRSNELLDAQGFAPVGRVVEGMEVLFRLNGDYGDTPPQGNGPSFACILSNGNAYLSRRYPRLDSIQRLRILD